MDSYFSLTNVAAAAISFYALFGTIFLNRKSRSHQENKTLASSLLAPTLPNSKHHVFPSFHGADVRTNFLSHVVKEFRGKGIYLFIDNNIERSKSIGPELVEAVKGSRVAIVLLSKNYASSTWCLNELVEIINCREEFGQTVMPLFYKVDPTDVKKQIGDFGKVFKKTCRGKTEEEIRRWKHALTEVAQIAGYHSTNWKTEAEMIGDIATDVSDKLNLSAPCSDFDGLVGMESKMNEMRPLLRLDTDEVRKIGILGPPGIGKSTIARSLFSRHSQDFELSIFIDNIKRKYAVPSCSDDYSVKLDFQKQFMSQLTNEKDINIPHLGVIKDRLKDKKVLIVLDDVDHSIQLEAMAKETSWFAPGSRIIITTQDKNVLKTSGVDHIHMVNLPSHEEALQMFCMHAFGRREPEDGFEKLAWEVRNLVGGLPLGLRVMGSHFRGMSKQSWTEALSRLKIHLDRDGEIASILKFSYDALNDEDKRLFLYIACFFSGEPVNMVARCLEKCFKDVRLGLHVLSEKSLIYTESGLIMMSTLLFQLGRQIVRKESVSEPGKRQFLFDATDIGEVINDDKDNSSVIGITLEPNEDITWTSERAFERFSNLQFLRILSRGVNPLSLNYISRKLRVLIWPNIQMSCFPSSFNPEFLVQLDMPFSSLKKLWKEKKPLINLKQMNLNTSKSLKELPDFSTATNLHELNLRACSSLVKLTSSIGNASNLQILNLSDCSSLVKLPSTIGNACHLKRVDLNRCSRLVELPSSIWNIVNLEELNLRYCSSLVDHPSSIWNIVNFKVLDLHGCSSLVQLPSVENAMNLQSLILSGCSNLVKLPSSIGNAINLRRLDLSHCSSLVELPSSMRNLRKLSKLELKKCSKLEVNLANINLESLRELDFADCSLLKSYSTDIQEPDPWIVSSLRGLVPRGIKNLVSLHLLSDSLGEHLSGCSLLKSYPEISTDIEELDSWIERGSCLHRLVLRGMKKLVSLPPLPDSLLELDAEGCESLERIDCSFHNPDILLNFRNCFKLNQEAIDLISLMRTSEYAVFPAKEVPICFTYRSSGSSLTLKLNQLPVGKSTKFKACFICTDEDEDGIGYWGDAIVCCSITSGGNALTSSYKEVGRVLTGHLYTFEVEVQTEEVTSTELLFEFEVNWVMYNSKVCDINECGLLQLLEVPLLSFRDVEEDYELSDSDLEHTLTPK